MSLLPDEASPPGQSGSLAQQLEVARALLEKERAARAEAQRMNALKDEFLSIVAHELRSPLGAILGWAHMLRRRGGEEEFNKGLDVIEQSVRAQSRLIEDLMDLSRITSGRLRLDLQRVEPRSFIDAATGLVQAAADEKGLRIDKALDLTAGPVMGDPGRLQQAMCSLLSNAVKFTAEGGRIRIELRRAEGHAEISVSDSGIGMAPDLLARVFERFGPAEPAGPRRQGLGLGLAIARHLVELHGGQLLAQSAGEGQGATFLMRLALAPPAKGHDT